MSHRGENLEKSACVSCQSPCIDIDAERSYWEILHKPGRKLTQYGYVGLVIDFYIYYFLFSGNFDYYTIPGYGVMKQMLRPKPDLWLTNLKTPVSQKQMRSSKLR